LALAKKYFGPVKSAVIEKEKPRVEIPQNGERRITVKLPATLDYLIMGYKVPSLNTTKDDTEIYALEVLAWILDGGASSRMTRELIREKQIAATTSISYNLHARLQTLLTLSAVPAKGKKISDIEVALREQIQRVRTRPVSKQELKRAKTQILTGRVYEKDSTFYQAMQLGTLETVGIGWQADQQFDEKIRAVTIAQIQAVAKKYLIDDRLTVAILDPQPIKKAAQGSKSK
jgi:zinc protease